MDLFIFILYNPEFDTFENKKMLTKSVVVRSVSIFLFGFNVCYIFFTVILIFLSSLSLLA